MPRLPLQIALSFALGIAPATAAPPAGEVTPPAPKPLPATRATPDTLDPTGYRAEGPRHVVRIDAARRAILDGVAVIARQDYEAFTHAEIATTDLDALLARGARLDDAHFLLLLNAGIVDTSTEDAARLAETPAIVSAGRSLHLVQFAAPVRAAWHAELVATGARIVTPLQRDAYLVQADATARARLQSLRGAAHVRAVMPYLASQRVHPSLGSDAGGPIVVQLVEDAAANAATLERLRGSARDVPRIGRRAGYVNVQIDAGPGAIAALADRGDVVSVNPDGPTHLHDERQNRLVTGFVSAGAPVAGDHLGWLAARGFTQAQFDASGFVVNVVDSGLDNGTVVPNHFALYTSGDPTSPSRVAFSRVVGTPGSSGGRGVDGHGTLNAHIVGGYVPGGAPFTAAPHADAQGFRYGLGVAPFVRLGASTVFDPDYTEPDAGALERAAWDDGARISTNSWGNTFSGAYTPRAQTYDALVRDAADDLPGLQELVILFSAGNAGPAAETVREPGVAKNVLTVGASESVQPFGGFDGCAITDNGANHAEDIIGFSSRGPAIGGRHKPDLVAPGTHISGGVWQDAPPPSPWSTGAAAPGFTGATVCGGPSPSLYWPLQQQWYTASSGTSHSTPAVAGGAALLRQHFLNQGRAAPSPAMTKAMLMNSARHLTGVGANDTLWSNRQGMGLLDLGRALDSTPRLLRDQDPADRLVGSGGTRAFTATVARDGEPLRVTLAWTDAPGPTNGAPQLNDLDLVVDIDDRTYFGNVFSGAASTTGGDPDRANNVESVFLPAGVAAGTRMAVRVLGAGLVADGVPGNGDAIDQDFALVVHNAAAVDLPYVREAGLDLVSESATPANGAPDPGERVVYALGLDNIGVLASTATTATLRSGGGVHPAGAAQAYGTLQPGAAAVAREHALVVDPATSCGSEVTATWDIASSGTPLGTIRHVLRTGVLEIALEEGFESTQSPSLPAGWLADIAIGGATWRTVTDAAADGAQSAGVQAPTTVADTRLVSPVFAVDTAEAVLSFRQRFALENGFDGAVLEMRVDGGTFVDVLSAGASFLEGGYGGAVSADWSNPLAGRAAWTGASGGWRDVRVALPASLAGHVVQFRWRVGTDESLSPAGSGQWVDTVELRDGYRCSPQPDRLFADGFDAAT